MNNERRKLIKKAISYVDEASRMVDAVKSQEESAMQNIPESLQDSDRYYAMEEAIDSLDEASDSLESAKDSLEEIVGE